MSYFIHSPRSHRVDYKGVEAEVFEEYGPFETTEDAIDWWIEYNGGSPIGLYHSTIRMVERP